MNSSIGNSAKRPAERRPLRLRRRLDVPVLAIVAAAGLAAAGPALADRTAAPPSHPGNSNATTTHPNGKPPTPPTPRHGAPTSGSAQGIVQSVASGTVVLAQLDGSTVSIAVTPGTRVFVDGIRAGVLEVKPGFVVSARWVAGKARVLQAFDLSPASAVIVGVVRSVSEDTIVVATSNGRTVRVRVGPKTRVLIDGNPATLRAVKAGYTAVFSARSPKAKKPATELRFLRPV